MYHKKAAIFLKQQDHRNPHVPKNYPLHLIHVRICVKHIFIFNCFFKKMLPQRNQRFVGALKICNLKNTDVVVWIGVGGMMA